MKNFIKKGLIIAWVIFMGLFVFKPYSAHAASKYNDYQEQFNVSPIKAWQISFNNPVNLYTAQNSICVYDSSNNAVPVTISIDPNNSKVVVVKPTYEYLLGKKYSMVIKSNCSSSNNKQLNSNIRMFFTIKTKLDPSDYNNNNSGGIPNITGMIIVGTNRAYAVGYLLSQPGLASDINGDPSKAIYYIPDASDIYYNNVKILFGDDLQFSDLYTLHENQKIDNTIVYTDAIGSTSTYVWNTDTGQYELQKPSVSVDVNLESITGLPTVKLNKVMAMPDAAYYNLEGTNVIRKIGDITVASSLNSKKKIFIYSSDQTEIGYGYIDVSKQDTNIIFPITVEDNKSGNTGGNSNNNGSVVLGSDGYTYYLNTGDNNTIYKTDHTGQYSQQIGLDKSQYMNEQSGWIYYSNYSDDQRIYRMKTDGTRIEKVCDDSAAYLVVFGDWIYYSNHSQQGRLYRIGVSAGASTKDDIQPKPSSYVVDAAGKHGLAIDTVKTSQTVPYDEVAYINVASNWVYYVNNSDDHKIYKSDLSGNVRVKLNDEWSECAQVVGDEIYYCSKIGEIMKVGTDGNSTPVDLGERTNNDNPDKTFSINVSGDWIYYSNKNDYNTLYKVKNDGSGEKYKLTNFPIYYVMTAGERLYIVSTKNVQYTLPINTTGGDTPIPVNKTAPDNGVVKVNDITKVVDYSDVDQTIDWIEDKYLPEKVTAVMQDNKQQELAVKWDTKNKKFSGGIWYYTGSILGYNKTVSLKLIIPSQMLNARNDVHVIRNPITSIGKYNDAIEITPELKEPTHLKNINIPEVQAKPGDIIRVYGDNSKTFLLGSGTIGTDLKTKISGIDLHTHGSVFYITIQRSGKYESNYTKIVQMDAPLIMKDTNKDDTNANDIDARDTDNNCAGVTGRDFTMYGWKDAQWSTTITQGNTIDYDTSNDYNSMYIVKAGVSLDMSSKGVKPVTILDSDGNSITKIPLTYASEGITNVDPNVKLDSLNGPLKDGFYSIYISRHYYDPDDELFVTADPNGSRPIVTGEVSTLDSALEQATGENLPYKNTVIGRVDPQSASDILVNQSGDTVTLSKNINKGEEIWFIPSTDGALNAIAKWTAEANKGTALEYKDDFYNSLANDLSAHPGMYKDTSGALNNFKVDSLQNGLTYHIFIVNDVGATEVTNWITIDADKPTLTLKNPPAQDSNGNYYYDITNTTDPLTKSITISYSDPGVSSTGYTGRAGTIYVIAGNYDVVTSDTIKYSTIKTIPRIGNNGTNTSIAVSQLNKGTYPVTIVAVDAAGNISEPITKIMINNPSSGGNSNS